MSGSSSGGTVRYAPYIEEKHTAFLTLAESSTNVAIAANPYGDYVDIPVDAGFFGTGYTLANFPSLFDIFGKFVAGLDVDALWEQMYEGTINSPTIDASVTAHSALLDDEIDETLLPKFQTGMRDMNAVMTSSYVVGKAVLFNSKIKEVSKMSADFRYKMVPIAQARWEAHLNWNNNVASGYANMLKHYFTIKHDITGLNIGMAAESAMWSMKMLDFYKADIGALQGAVTTSGQEVSQGSKALGGALSGAAAGASIGGPWGAAIGGIVGGVAGLLS